MRLQGDVALLRGVPAFIYLLRETVVQRYEGMDEQWLDRYITLARQVLNPRQAPCAVPPHRSMLCDVGYRVEDHKHAEKGSGF
jgi:hypothetical protein